MEKILRNVVSIDESRCTGSGLCLDRCHDKALELRNGKVALIDEALCCGMGACLAGCPEKALSLMRRVAAPYQGTRPAVPVYALAGSVPGNEAGGCRDGGLAGGEAGGCREGGAPLEPGTGEKPAGASGCQEAESAPTRPGSAATAAPVSTAPGAPEGLSAVADGPCAHWPIKLCVAPDDDPALRGASILVAGDCTAFACADFHGRIGRGRAVLIGCPKFESPKVLTDKMIDVFRRAGPVECSIARMEKPCCKGLLTICADAAKAAGFTGPIRESIVYCSGAFEEK